MQPGITDVVKNLIILNVLLFACVYLLPMGAVLPDLKLYFPASPRFKPFQIVSHMFMHADIRHLGFNMLCLYFLGVTVERYTGAKKFFILYLASGLGAMLAHMILWYFQYQSLGYAPGSVLGASGAVYGVMIAFAVLFPDLKLSLLFIPIAIKARYMALGLITYDLISGLSGIQNGVANFAHIGGAVTGAVIAYFWLKPKWNR